MYMYTSLLKKYFFLGHEKKTFVSFQLPHHLETPMTTFLFRKSSLITFISPHIFFFFCFLVFVVFCFSQDISYKYTTALQLTTWTWSNIFHSVHINLINFLYPPSYVPPPLTSFLPCRNNIGDKSCA